MGLVSVRELTAAVESVDEVLGVNLQGVSSAHLSAWWGVIQPEGCGEVVSEPMNITQPRERDLAIVGIAGG